MNYKFYYVDNNGCDLYSKEYSFDTFEEAEYHARRQLAVNMQGLECIEISSELITRHIVKES